MPLSSERSKCGVHGKEVDPVNGCPDCEQVYRDMYAERPTQNAEGTWDALDRNGYGHPLGYATQELAEAWISGYESGAQENM